MRKGIWSVAALGMLLAGAAALLTSPAVQAAETVTMGSDSNPNAFKFFPGEITVPVGTTVVWRNLSDIPHDATARDNSFGSEQLAKGQDFSFTFKTPGEIPYYCSVSGHEDAGMTGVIKVTGGAAPTTATTPTTQPGTATTATTIAGAGGTTTTTGKGAAGASTTTTTAPGDGATTTTLAPALTPTSAPEVAETTTTTAAGHGGGEEAAADDHSSEGGQETKEKKKNSPVGIAFASVSTVLLTAIAGKLLASKS